MRTGIGQPLAARVYALLRDDIVAGRLGPGDPLVQEQLAARYEVSRTPIRDALTQLTNEGLATLVAGKGYFVNDLSRNDVADVFAVRLTLESMALREAFGKHTPKQLHRLRALTGEARLVDPSDSAEVFDLSLRFHQALLEPCPNAYLLEVLSTVWNHPIQRRITLTYQPGEQHMERVAHDHDRLLDALEANDLEAALAVLASCHDPFDHRGAPLGRSTPAIEPSDAPA